MDALTEKLTVSIICAVIGSILSTLVKEWIIPIFQRNEPRDHKTMKNKIIPKPKKFISIILAPGIGAILGLFVGLCVIYPLFLSACPIFAPTQIRIDSPEPNSAVARLVMVQGTACHPPKDKEIWLLVVPSGVTAYYPQAGPVVVSNDGAWSATAYVGLDNPVDIGREFTLIMTLVDSQGTASIKKYFEQAGPEYKGIEPLPEGIHLMAQVQVVRK